MREEELWVEMRRQARLLRCSVRSLLRKAVRRMRKGEASIPLVKQASDYHSLAQHFEEAADRLVILAQDGKAGPLPS